MGFGSRGVRAAALAAMSAAAIVLAGCGGGVAVDGDGFSVGVTVDGSPYGSGSIDSGTQSMSLYAGQSVAFAASESVRWTLYAGNAAIPADGSTVYYGGVSVRATAVSPTRIVVDTGVAGAYSPPVPFTLTATSTWDGAQLSTIYVYLY